MTNVPRLTVIMPAYNEEENLPGVIQILGQKLSQWVPSYEILVVDDGSTDRTASIANDLSCRDNRIRLLRHEINRGPGSGVLTGIANARGELVTFIPADLAITLDQFPKYLEGAKAADVVVGIRSDRSDYSTMRKINSYAYIWMVKLLFCMRQRQFNYVHLYRREIFRSIDIWSEGVFITAEIMIRARDRGFTIKEVEIDYVPRVRGAASCGRPSVIGKTFTDLIAFWFYRAIRRLDRLQPKYRARDYWMHNGDQA